jgi:hypothetical protein
MKKPDGMLLTLHRAAVKPLGLKEKEIAMTQDFMAELQRDAAQLVEAVDRSPASALFNGSATRDIYIAFLQETWHYVRYTSSTLQFAGERLKVWVNTAGWRMC